ncbi:MAG: hypothetical protein A2534_01175 [Candidatus Magasanikbacteria bacterium RIFOXYD2_FULL_39_9]|nr:MAG: hypothetical protein A2534_01175 [Candidatus Magasanikbacteria bacterium RIFOXYD2_FULL_39_9]
MEKCRCCKWTGNKHDVACPEGMSGITKVQALKAWDDGYRHGRGGREEPADTNASYTLGYLNGVVALEEVENGFDPNSDVWDALDSHPWE